MSKAGEERYVFESEWYDQQAALIRKYLFTFFPSDQTIEMVILSFFLDYAINMIYQNFGILMIDMYIQYDLKCKKVFLKRMTCPGVSMEEMFIGSIISVFSR